MHSPAQPVLAGDSRLTVTLNVRVSPEVDALVQRAMANTGDSKRAVVEKALRQAYS
ncbi:MAG: hypothetical protein ABI140_03085 [Jatrophihabitantaceae bacterium]